MKTEIPIVLPFATAEVWANVAPSVLVSVYDGQPLQVNARTPAVALHMSSSDIPEATFVRLSQSVKRLEGELLCLPRRKEAWGTQYEVRGNGQTLGIAWTWERERFRAAHVLPDVVHMVGVGETDLQSSATKVELDTKGLKLLTIKSGQATDLLLSTKVRFFRARYNPKNLGFAKEER